MADQLAANGSGFATGTEHVLAELERLELLLKRQVLRLRAANLLTEHDFRGLYISDELVDALLESSRPDENAVRAIHELDQRIEESRVANESRSRACGTPLRTLTQMFELSPFEIDVLMIAVAPELDLRWETLFAYVQNDVTKRRPTVDLALKLLSPTLEERVVLRKAFAPDAALVRERLVRLIEDPQDRDPALMARFVKADERIVSFLLEQDVLDQEIQPFTRFVVPGLRLSDLVLPDRLRSELVHASEAIETAPSPVLLLCGAAGVGKRSVAEAICAELERSLLLVDVRHELCRESDPTTIATHLAREARLRGAGLYVGHFDSLSADVTRARRFMTAIAEELAGSDLPLFVGSEGLGDCDVPELAGRLLSLELPVPSSDARSRIWTQALDGNRGGRTESEIALVAGKFALTPGQIRDAASLARHLAGLRKPDQRGVSVRDLHAAARSQSGQGLRRLAQKIDPSYAWSDIVLPPGPLRQLKEICASVLHRHLVYSDWGFERQLSLGKGLNALFSGASGTGKTMAAEVVANELGLDLYKIDLSGVVSKYIGETEKNLSKIFAEAQASNAILFFDEADALFGKRSQVKDAHDRYANIEVAYLLQKMEEYEGIVVLATNLRKNVDDAFARRLDHVVEFPFPDVAHRKRIWKRMFPPQAPLGRDVDFEFLASQFELAGGNIRNIVLAAAFNAAEDGGVIEMNGLIHAAARELEKIGQLPTKAAFREYYALIGETG